MPDGVESGVPQPEQKEVEVENEYQLLYNAAAGEYYVNEWTPDDLADWENSGLRNQYGHFSEVGMYRSKEELEKAIEDLRGPARFAVFEDRAAGEVYFSKEDNLTGNWRGSREGHANFVAEFDTEDEAKDYVEKSKAYYDRLQAEREGK